VTREQLQRFAFGIGGNEANSSPREQMRDTRAKAFVWVDDENVAISHAESFEGGR
jgi:hypothetical protein